MSHLPLPGPTRTSGEVRMAAAMVAAGAVLGLGLLVAAVLLLRVDPGFLFAVLPVVIGACAGAGLYVMGASVALSRQLLRHAPGARLTTAALGGGLAAVGLIASVTLRTPIGLPLVGYGAVLVWLMVSRGAAADLGPWVFLPPRVTSRRRQTNRGAVAAFGPWTATATASGPAGPQRPAPRPWWELWDEGLRRGLPVPDFVGFVVMILLFLPSQPLVFMGLFGKRSGALALGLVLVAGAMGIAVVLERRMKVRLGLA